MRRNSLTLSPAESVPQILNSEGAESHVSLCSPSAPSGGLGTQESTFTHISLDLDNDIMQVGRHCPI